jgi:hypothetical protein
MKPITGEYGLVRFIDKSSISDVIIFVKYLLIFPRNCLKDTDFSWLLVYCASKSKVQ